METAKIFSQTPKFTYQNSELVLQIPKFTKAVEIFRPIPKVIETGKMYSRISVFMDAAQQFTRIPKIMETVEFIFTNSKIYENGKNIFMEFSNLNGLPY